MNSATILVIEDDEAVRGTLTDILELNGYQTFVAKDGAEGLAVARREKPSLIITDLSMPVVDGYGVLTSLRQDHDLINIPVIVVSAKIEREANRRGMDLGAADYITKPFTEAEVLHSVATRLEKKELLDELDAFAHTVAHDLRNPLCGVKGWLSLAAMEMGPNPPAELPMYLQQATKAADTLGAIIDELLILAGVRRQAVVFQQIDTTAVIAETLCRVQNVLQEFPATVHQPESWPVAYGHPPWVVHIWVNYITNAAKYAGPDADITLGSGPGEDPGRVRFWVQDRGPGLDAAACQRMFVPFTRVSAIRAKGHGLGLSIVRRIAEKLGGAVGVESQVGQGSRFWFELPATPPMPEMPEIDTSAAVPK